MKHDYTISLLFEPRDLWIGIYWNKLTNRQLKIYVCLVPMFLIVFTIYTYKTKPNTTGKHHRWWKFGNEYTRDIPFSKRKL